MDSIHLIGAETVRHAAGEMQDAAHTMRQAANIIAEAVAAQRDNMHEALNRFEQLVVRLEVAAQAFQAPASLEPCKACNGAGTWQTECCSGANGCSCRGEVIDMGTCNGCGGKKMVEPSKQDPTANIRSIAGRSYIGSGPR